MNDFFPVAYMSTRNNSDLISEHLGIGNFIKKHSTYNKYPDMIDHARSLTEEMTNLIKCPSFPPTKFLPPTLNINPDSRAFQCPDTGGNNCRNFNSFTAIDR